MDENTKSPLERACEAVHSTTELARLLTERRARKVSKASVSRWKKDGIPTEMCPDIEDLTGIPCEELRPDVNWAVLRRSRRRKAA